MLMLRIITTAGWDLALAGAFLITWLSPYALGDTVINQLSALMILEFVAIHAGGFMSSGVGLRGNVKWGRALALLVLGILYLGMAVSLGGAYDNPYPVAAAIGVMVPRLVDILTPVRDEEEGKARIAVWVTMTVLYMVTCMSGIMGPMPRLGITPESVTTVTSDGGHLHEHYRFMAWGTMYFTLVALLNLVPEWFWRYAREEASNNFGGR